MRPGGIQDESSKHEHQNVPKLLRFLSQTKDVVRAEGRQYRSTPLQFSQSSSAVRKRRIRASSLMTLQRRRLRHNVIYSYTAWMGRVLLAAEKSQLIDPAFVKKVAAAKYDLDVAAAAPTMCKESDCVHRALCKRAMRQLVRARSMYAYLCKVLELERAEL